MCPAVSGCQIGCSRSPSLVQGGGLRKITPVFFAQVTSDRSAVTAGHRRGRTGWRGPRDAGATAAGAGGPWRLLPRSCVPVSAVGRPGAVAWPEVMPNGTPTVAASGSSSRTRREDPRSAPLSSSSVIVPIANATAGRTCSAPSPGLCWSQCPARTSRPSHDRPHLRADCRLPRGSGIRGHPDEHVAAVGVQLVPVQMLGGEPARGLAVQRRDQQPVPIGGRGQPGQGQDIEVVTVEAQGIGDARYPVVRAGRAARCVQRRAGWAGLGTGGTSSHDHSPPGSRMGAPPATGARRSRSALHSARDVKPGRAPDTGPRGPARDANAAGPRNWRHPARTPAGLLPGPRRGPRAHTRPHAGHTRSASRGTPADWRACHRAFRRADLTIPPGPSVHAPHCTDRPPARTHTARNTAGGCTEGETRRDRPAR